MSNKKDKRVYIRCPWCSRQPVRTKRGRIVSHLTPDRNKCVGINQLVAR